MAAPEKTDHLTIKINVPVWMRDDPTRYITLAGDMASAEAQRAAEWLLNDLGGTPTGEDLKAPVAAPVVVIEHVPSGDPVYDECLSCQ